MTQTHINAQTESLLTVKHGNGFATLEPKDGHGAVARVRLRGSKTNNVAEKNGNARLFAASFNAFNQAGRALGVDAAELGESIDLAALIRAAACNEHKEVDEWLAENVTRAQLAKLPKPAQP